MAEKKPLCNYAGEIKELQTGDTLPGGGGAPDVSTATGILPVANGGTGQTTLAAAIEELLATLSTTQGNILIRGSSAWAALAAGAAGQILRSGGAGADPSWATFPLIMKQKSADEDVVNTTLNDDDHISFPIGANESWAALHIGTHYNLGGATVGARWKWAGPSGYAGRLTSWSSIPSLFLNDVDITLTYHVPFTGTITSDAAKLFVNLLRVENGGNAGTMQFQFAQNTTNASAYRMRRGGLLIAAKL